MSRTIYIIITSLITLLRLYSYMIVIAAICSWFLKPNNKFLVLVRSLTEPIIYPFRRISMKLMERMRMPLDFSPMMAYLALQIMIGMLQRLLF